MKQRGNILFNVDWLIIGLYLTLVSIGLLNIYAADFTVDNSDFFDMGNRSGKQFIWICASLVIGLIIMMFDSKFYQVMSPYFFLVILGLQVLVLFVARDLKGARAWLDVGPFKLQPSEFSKFATALFLAYYMSMFSSKEKSDEGTIESAGKNLMRFISGKKVFSLEDINIERQLIPFVIVLTSMVMILLQDDTGTALVFLSFFVVFYREGVIGNIFIIGISAIVLVIITLMFDKHIAITALGALAILFYAVFIKETKVALISIGGLIIYFILKLAFDWNNALNTYFVWGWLFINTVQNFIVPNLWKKVEKLLVLGTLFLSIAFVNSIDTMYGMLQIHQKQRIEILLGKVENKRVSFQTDQSLNAIGSGGLTGKGYLEGTHTNGDWVPEQSTDYIFCTVGEEWGFLGTSIVVILFLVLILRIILKAEAQRSSMSRIYGYCVASILFFHLLINIGMTIQIMPVIGIPLPFFSYGGSSLFGFTALLFMFVKFDSKRLDVL
jgi:rod shape determining protein RodA